MYVAIVTVFCYHYTDSVGLTIHYVLITCSIIIQWTQQKISRLLATIEEEKRKEQVNHSPFSNEDTDDTTQGNYAMILLFWYVYLIKSSK